MPWTQQLYIIQIYSPQQEAETFEKIVIHVRDIAVLFGQPQWHT
jgi:hypothetical protein